MTLSKAWLTSIVSFVASLAATGNFALTQGAGGAALTVGANNNSTTYSGVINLPVNTNANPAP